MCRADPALTALSCCDLHTVPRIGIFVRGGHGGDVTGHRVFVGIEEGLPAHVRVEGDYGGS
jgi:hypothetical protein